MYSDKILVNSATLGNLLFWPLNNAVIFYCLKFINKIRHIIIEETLYFQMKDLKLIVEVLLIMKLNVCFIKIREYNLILNIFMFFLKTF